jgi:predicted DNA-binding ribbon-helix-helix protein
MNPKRRLGQRKASLVVKRSVVVAGHKTSVSLEGAFWNALKEIAVAQNLTAATLISKIDSKRQPANLSSAIRLYVLEHYRRAGSASDNR